MNTTTQPHKVGDPRIIPCLDINNGRVVKGVNFTGLVDAGDPAEVAQRYAKEGADVITLLDISATTEGRGHTISVVEKIAKSINIPIYVGGGVRTTQDIKQLLNAGASKVSISSAAITNPELIRKAAQEFGSNRIIVAIDAKRTGSGFGVSKWEVVSHGGTNNTGLDAIEWAQKMANLGAGEILLTSMDKDGTKEGFDLELTKAVSSSISVPVIASGGVGNINHLVDGVVVGGASAVLAASIFHFGHYTINEAKEALQIGLKKKSADNILEQVSFDTGGLIAAIAQDYSTGKVLMMAWMNQEALLETINSGIAVYWSRSRKSLWRKGEQSGHTQLVKEIMLDCDGDTILLMVEQQGNIACHTGRNSCFYRSLSNDPYPLWKVSEPVLKDPEDIYK